MDAVAAEVSKVPEGAKPLPEFDEEDARKCIWLAAEKWLERDLNKLVVTGIEQEFEFLVTSLKFNQRVHGFFDVVGACADPEFKEKSSVNIVIDWKTSRNTLDATWRQRLIDSFQWRIYGHAAHAELVSYRGINRKGETKELLLRIPHTNSQEVEEQVLGLGSMRAALVNLELPVWPRNSPNACFAYNSQCPYYEDCEGYSMPRVCVDHSMISYSQMNNLMLCPERTRRGIIDEGQGTEETNFGQAVHRGLAELWRQAFKL